MKKKIIGLLALSLAAFSLYAVNEKEEREKSNTDCYAMVNLRNNTDKAARFLVMYSEEPTTAGIKAVAKEYIIPAKETGELPFRNNGKYMQDITGFGPAYPSKNVKVVPVVTSRTVNVPDSESFGNFKGGRKVDMQKVFTDKGKEGISFLTFTVESFDKNMVFNGEVMRKISSSAPCSKLNMPVNKANEVVIGNWCR